MGTLVGSAVAAVGSAGMSSNNWDRLGALVLGFLVGALVAVVVYIAALTVAARRVFPPGRRAAPVLLTLLAHAMVFGVTARIVSTLQPLGDGEPVATTLLALAALACGPAVFLACGTTGRIRRAALGTVASITLAACVTAAVSHASAR
ncbi:hypothetical protein BG844_24810 [Couchioplanes caeruleus subsp. caeruleus]|uniref:Uncharacterized protein n=1 Tax=Couchioplanes caeruleus subsp. caeruleus TaxID=56427 RepID=A0A1K0GL21_9ACTN|nr:hypothetical protein BG844_24810 [Couchioplanes caeruleus subsp. caeruleus]